MKSMNKTCFETGWGGQVGQETELGNCEDDYIKKIGADQIQLDKRIQALGKGLSAFLKWFYAFVGTYCYPWKSYYYLAGTWITVGISTVTVTE